MPYTLWSRGRLLGESDLGFVQVYSNLRTGWFRPSPEGEKFMSVVTGGQAAVRRLARLRKNPIRRMTEPPDDGGDYSRDLRATTAYADLAASVTEIEALDLKLRDPDGLEVNAESIWIDDIEIKLSWIPRRERKRLGIDPEPWEPANPDRYQIHVRFPGPRSMIWAPDA